jgi:hypothetical protein
LKGGKVTTVAGIGTQANRVPPPGASGPARTTALCSPWDLIQLPGENSIYIAMAGPHQIWKLDVDTNTISVFAGSGYENIEDGPAQTAKFAQPSGLATDGDNLFVADSEDSGVRAIIGVKRGQPFVRTIVGRGLFEFGDRDGNGGNVRLQHCLGLAYAGDHLYIADTYNNKVKVCTPATRSVKTLSGGRKPGDSDAPPLYYEPGGLSAAGESLYLADTNNHKIKVIDLKNGAVKTLKLDGLEPPKPVRHRPVFPNAKTIDLDAVKAAPGKSITLAVSIGLPKGFKLNEEVPLPYLVETPGKTGVLPLELSESGKKIKPPETHFQIDVPLAEPAKAGDSLDLRVSTSAFVCSESSSLCQIRSFIWNVPIRFADGASSEPIALEVRAGR